MTRWIVGLWVLTACGSAPTTYQSELRTQSTWGQDRWPGRAGEGPTARGGEVVVQGDLNSGVLEAEVRRHSNMIAACYSTALKDDDSLRGEVTVSFTVMPDGTLAGVETAGAGLGDSVPSCVGRQFAKIALAEGAVTESVMVRYPVVFAPGGSP